MLGFKKRESAFDRKKRLGEEADARIKTMSPLEYLKRDDWGNCSTGAGIDLFRDAILELEKKIDDR